MSKTGDLRKAAEKVLRDTNSTPVQVAQAALVKGVSIPALIAACKRIREMVAK
jgi:hypothetical protein